MLLAHSAKPDNQIPEQSYIDHISNVVNRAVRAADAAGRFSLSDGQLLREVVRIAAEYHDLGKLDQENQEVLSGQKKSKSLPVQHTDAGTAYLLTMEKQKSMLAAALVRSHHIGLPDFVEESNRGEAFLRDSSVSDFVNEKLEYLLGLHKKEMDGDSTVDSANYSLNGNISLFFRIALSCLADGDHTDTSIHYGEYPKEEACIELKPAERLSSIDKYVSALEKNNDKRSFLRSEMYHHCRDSGIHENIASCDSPVGSGKTTSVMAHLLAQAQKRNLRRVIVVLPFTNIITQSVEVYRNALVLQGENPEDVVAELHYRADYQDVQTRHLTALWKAPIIVTTAVSFFETLASNTPSTLRRLHNLPGSAIFVDESHAALPAKLLPLAWHWIKGFASEWSCYWVLASGSLNRFWQIPEFDKSPPIVPEIVPNKLREELASYESNRIIYRYNEELQDADQLVEWIVSLPGPRIVILNTVQSAAVIALTLSEKVSPGKVEHLSTALTPMDRKETLDRVKKRLKDHNDLDWTLVATSCVEAGVDISFRTGLRELGSLVSLLQLAGRVNRQGNCENSEVWTFKLKEGGLLRQHPGLKDAAHVLLEFCNSDTLISPGLCTEALKREVRLAGVDLDKIFEVEDDKRFPQVENLFRVITTDTYVTVVDSTLILKIENGEKIDWKEIQSGSVQIWGYRLRELDIQEFPNKQGLYKWVYEYDPFIGIMSGVLSFEKFKRDSTCGIV